MARRYDLKCENGHYSETVMAWDEFHSDSHSCRECGASARVVILKAPEVSMDKVRDTDYSLMAGPEAKHWTSRKDRDAWLQRENRWIPDENEPKTKEAFGYLDQLREERLDVERKGDNWEEYLADKKRQENEELDRQMAENGLSITKVTAEEAELKLKKTKADRPLLPGEDLQGDSRWLVEKMQENPNVPIEDLLPHIPEPEGELSWED
jgi:hypothetical protein